MVWILVRPAAAVACCAQPAGDFGTAHHDELRELGSQALMLLARDRSQLIDGGGHDGSFGSRRGTSRRSRDIGGASRSGRRRPMG